MEWIKKVKRPGKCWYETKWFAWHPVKVQTYPDANERWKWLCWVKKTTNLVNTYYYDIPVRK